VSEHVDAWMNLLSNRKKGCMKSTPISPELDTADAVAYMFHIWIPQHFQNDNLAKDGLAISAQQSFTGGSVGHSHRGTTVPTRHTHPGGAWLHRVY